MSLNARPKAKSVHALVWDAEVRALLASGCMDPYHHRVLQIATEIAEYSAPWGVYLRAESLAHELVVLYRAAPDRPSANRNRGAA